MVFKTIFIQSSNYPSKGKNYYANFQWKSNFVNEYQLLLGLSKLMLILLYLSFIVPIIMLMMNDEFHTDI